MTTADLIKIFQKILQVNPEAILTGSNALTIQNIKLRRKPKDIDIHIPYGTNFNAIDGLKYIEEIIYLNDERINRTSYLYKHEDDHVKIDIFQPTIGYIGHEPKKLICDNITCTHFIDILTFKMQHALHLKSKSSNKHAADLVYIFLNNTNLQSQTFGEVTELIFGSKSATSL